MGQKLYPLFCHSCLLVLQGVGVAVDAFEVEGHGDRYIGSLFRVDELVTDDSKRNSK